MTNTKTKVNQKNTTTKKINKTKILKKDIPTIKKVEIPTNKPQKIEETNKTVNNSKLTGYAIIFLIILTIIIVFGLTYAYFSINIEDLNPNYKDVEIKSAELIVKYQDGDSNVEIGAKIEPGNILTKEFSAKNEGTDTGIYTIVLENIEHDLGHKSVNNKEELISDISYKLYKINSLNSSITETVISAGTLPFKSGEKQNAFKIYEKDEVLVNEINKYRLELTYINHSNIDQSDSMGGNLKLKVNLVEYDKEQRTSITN